jgi:hypothetical protein
MSVIINGDKNLFKSKNAIIRIKKDVKELEHTAIDAHKYLLEGYSFKFEIIGNDTHVHIINDMIEKERLRKLELHKQFKQNMESNRKERSGEMKKKLSSMKRSVPDKIFDSYMNIVSKYKLANLPAPDEVINNVDKYRLQISAVMGKVSKISDDIRVSNAIRNYFTALGEYLNIQPLTINMNDINQSLQQVPQQVPHIKDDTDDEDDEDIIPNLVKN